MAALFLYRLNLGNDSCMYYNERFIRGSPEELKFIVRISIKSKSILVLVRLVPTKKRRQHIFLSKSLRCSYKSNVKMTVLKFLLACSLMCMSPLSRNFQGRASHMYLQVFLLLLAIRHPSTQCQSQASRDEYPWKMTM